jgi:hypothetical protein
MKIRALLKPAPFVAILLVSAPFAACSKKSGEAIVVAKEYIAAGEERETPTPGESATPAEVSAASISPTPGPDQSADARLYTTRDLAEDEIVVDDYVMKKDVQGTSKDPRAYPGLEQWRVSVQLTEGGRGMTVRARQEQYKRLKVGDRVKVRYSEGNYSGTVWDAEIVD